MKASVKLLLIMAGLAGLLAVLSAGSAAALTVDFENVEYSEWAYASEEMTVSFDLVLTDATWEDVEAAGVMWDDTYLGEFVNYTTFPNEAHVSANMKNHYSVSFGPLDEGTIYLYTFCNINGWWGSWYELAGTVEIRTTPLVRFGGMMGWNLAGAEHQVSWSIQNADSSEIEETSVYWDSVSHSDGEMDRANYPNRSQVITFQHHSPFYINITLPEETGPVFIIVHALINGRDFYDPLERSVSVAGVPTFNVTAPHAVFAGSTVIINWTIPDTPGAYIENTSAYWDTISHSSAIDKANYAHRSDVLAGDDSRTYGVMLQMPEEEGTVYLVIHCWVKLYGLEFYSDEEVTVAIRAEPVVTVTEYPEHAFVGGDAHFVWTVSAAAEDMEETALYWDTMSHAGILDRVAYPHASVWMIGEEDATYDVTLEMPVNAGTFYFIVHAQVLGQDFYVAEELSVPVHEAPAVEVTEHPDQAFVGDDVRFVWTVAAEAEDTDETTIYWDTTSHSDNIDRSAYPHASVWLAGEEDGTYEVTFEMPEDPGTFYFIAHAQVMGADFYVAQELEIDIRALPTVSILTVPEEGLGGEVVTIIWEVTGALETDTFATNAHWGGTSHIDEPLPSNYEEHSQDIDWDSSGEYSFQLTLPDAAGKVYLVVSANVMGREFADPNEVAITVKVPPSVADVQGPAKVEAGKKASVTFALDNATDPDSVEVLWDTESRENATDYANSATATDNGDGTWTVEFEVPKKGDEVYYRVHVEDDGSDVYSPEESFKVTEKADDSPGPGFVMAVVALSILAVIIAGSRRE